MHYRRDNCHWLHRKRKLRYTPRNPPPWFLCLELLRLSSWQLHLHQLSLVSSPLIIGGRLFSQAFAPPQLGAFTTALFPSLHALERSSPIVFIKSTRDFVLYNFYTVSALSFIWELFFSLHLLSHYSTSLNPTGTPVQSPCALVQFLFSKFLPIHCLCLTAAHPVTTPVQVKIGCQSLSPLLYFSSIIRVFINSPIEKSQSPNLTSLEKSPLHQILWTYGTQLFPCAIILLVFNRFITNSYIYKNSTVWIILPLSKFLGKIGGVTLVPLKTQSSRQNFLGYIYPSYCLSVYTTIC